MTGRLKMSIGVASLLAGAAEPKTSKPYYLFDGDLCQMSAQEEFLRARGFDVGRSNVYPGVYNEDDFRRALKLIWENQVQGWWHYQEKYVQYGICTAEEFTKALDTYCRRRCES